LPNAEIYIELMLVGYGLSLPILSAIFQVDLGLAGTRMSPFWILLELRVMDVVVTLELQDVQSPSQNVSTNRATPGFLQARCPSCHPTNSVSNMVSFLFNAITAVMC